MALLPISTWPDPVLAKKATPVEVVDDAVRKLIDDMFETMYDAEGVGLAAPQVAVGQRIIVIDCAVRDPEEKSPLSPKEPLALVNPNIVAREGGITWEEGCLSVPGYLDEIVRSRAVTVEGLDRNGAPLRIDATELLSVCLQHEIDHLDGILFIDRLSRLKQQMAKKKLRKHLANDEDGPRL